MGKIKNFFSLTTHSLKNLSVISSNVLLYGQIFIYAVLFCAACYLLHIYDCGKSDLFVIAAKNIKILIENAVFGLLLLWSGALMMDYMHKFER